MNSIWDNDFYNNPPLPLWSFSVDFSQYADISPEEADLLQKAIVGISIPEKTMQYVDTFYGGITVRHLTRAENVNEVTLTFSENNKMEIFGLFNRLYSSKSFNSDTYMESSETGENNDDENNSGVKYRDPINKTMNKIVVKVLEPKDNIIDTDYNVVKMIEFSNCQFVYMGGVEFSYESTEDVATVEAHFIYENLKYI